LNSDTTTPHIIPSKINLISLPWALFNRPSIQLGTLKAYIESRNPEFLVETSHPYLEVAAILGPDLYHWISRNPWVSEALYAPLVFPEKAASAQDLAWKYVKKSDPEIQYSFDYKFLVGKIEGHLRKWVESCDWTQYSLIGFSVCFHQLFASLAAAGAIKEKHPQTTIVFGGSSCGAEAGQSLLNAFDCIDYIIQGEGESGLLNLCAYISGVHNSPLPGNIKDRKSDRNVTPKNQSPRDVNQLGSLADLPVPNYDAYFSKQKKWFPNTPFIPILPVEFSRGCWWNKCSFCNLNLQWCGYRHKNADQMIHEVKTLASRHKCLDFTFVDNMLPPQEARKFFKMTGEEQADYNFFAEIRSAKSKKPLAEIFAIYRQGGLSAIQVGIEALSNSLLRKMQKGVSVIENISTMRGSLENNLQLDGNLILQFPGSSQAEAAETLEILDYVFPYRPLAAATFFLGHDSPVYKYSKKFGIRSIVNHPNSYKLFPKTILAQINLLVKDYRGDRTQQRKIWQPVLQKVRTWQRYHARRKDDPLLKPLLYYRDGGNFLLIRQELPDGKILHHRLQGASRQIYLYCTHITTDVELFAAFPHITPEKILLFLTDLKKKKILFSEENKYLALAVHFRD
jgi:ribosomal peptide maturation radical SAM protein 1